MTQSPVTPAVSWLLCSHVANPELKLALESCLAQDFRDFEIIFIANGPAAASVAQAVTAWFGHDRRLRVASTEMRHLSFSLSLGLHLARADLIARMDGDDVAASNRLHLQVDYMTAHPEVTVLGTAYTLIDAHGRPGAPVRPPLDDAAIRRALLKGNPFCHPTVMLRRRPVMAAGGYLGSIYAQDYDLWARLALDPTHRFANLPEVCVGYRRTGVGGARGARAAYAAMAAAQFRNLAAGAGWRWGAAAALSWFKACWRSR